MKVNKQELSDEIRSTAEKYREHTVGTKAGTYLEKAIAAAEQSRKLAMVRYAVLSFVHAQHNARSLKKASIQTLNHRPTDPQAERFIQTRSENQQTQSTANREMSYAIISALLGSLMLGDKDLFKAFNKFDIVAELHNKSRETHSVSKEELSTFDVRTHFEKLSETDRLSYIRKQNEANSVREHEMNEFVERSRRLFSIG